MTLLNYWHFITFAVIFAVFIAGIHGSLKQDKFSIKVGMIVSVTVISLMVVPFSVLVVDKYSKKVELYKLENKRLLSIEKIVYTGIVKNTGNHTIGEVTLEIKLVNKGHATGKIKGGSFYKSSGFLDFFSGGYNLNFKPQSATKEFIVATNLKPGAVSRFRVYFRYPPYFRSTSQFSKVWGH